MFEGREEEGKLGMVAEGGREGGGGGEMEKREKCVRKCQAEGSDEEEERKAWRERSDSTAQSSRQGSWRG
jgi:hypothetical protein